MAAGTSDQESASMWMRRVGGVKLISASKAIELARRVVNDEFGAIEVARNEPLIAVEDGDTWVVIGSESPEFNVAHPPTPNWAGPVHMRVSQFDGQILGYVFTFDWGTAQAVSRSDGG
jgi:hypothetical protein